MRRRLDLFAIRQTLADQVIRKDKLINLLANDFVLFDCQLDVSLALFDLLQQNQVAVIVLVVRSLLFVDSMLQLFVVVDLPLSHIVLLPDQQALIVDFP